MKKVGIIGSGVAGITLLKALVDQTEKRTSSQTNNLNLQIVLSERGRNFFDTFARSPSSNPVVVVHNPVTSRTEYQFFCNQGIKTMSSWIASLEDRFKTRIAHKPGLLHLPKNIHEQKKWEDIFKFGSSRMQSFVRVINSNNYGDFVNENSHMHKVILFTQRKTTPPLFKALSKHFKDKINFFCI